MPIKLKIITNPVIVKYINENFHPVKLDGEGKEPITYKDYTFKFKDEGRRGYHEFSALLLNGKLSYPTTIFFNDNVKILSRVPGFQNPKQIEPMLAYITRINKKADIPWEDFSKDYKNKIEK